VGGCPLKALFTDHPNEIMPICHRNDASPPKDKISGEKEKAREKRESPWESIPTKI